MLQSIIKLVILLCLTFVCSILAFEEVNADEDDIIYKNTGFNLTTVNFCFDPGRVRHASRVPEVKRGSMYPYGTILHYSCFEKFKLEGESGKIVCGSKGKWEPPNLPVCRPVLCSTPAVPHGFISSTSLEFAPKTSVVVFCRNGYRLLNKFVNKLECQNDGTWTGHNGKFTQELPECIESTCPPLSEVSHATISYRGSRGADHGYVEGTQADISCHQGYLMNGTTNSGYVGRLVCHNGEWNQTNSLQCNLVGCTSPPFIAHGSREVLLLSEDEDEVGRPTGVAYPVGISVSYWCNPGYVLKASSFKYRCTSNGNWMPTQFPTCEKLEMESSDSLSDLDFVMCPQPPSIEFGFALDIRDRYFPTATVNYFCMTGFHLVGASQLQCDEDGTWHPRAPPKCEMIINKPAFEWGSFERTSPSTKDIISKDADNESQTLSLVTAGCVLGILSIILIIAVAYQRRRCNGRFNHVQLQQPINSSSTGNNTHISQYHDQDRVSLIAFADGAHLTLPTYEESTRQRNPVGFTGINPSSNRSSGRYSRFALHRDQSSAGNQNRQQLLSHNNYARSASVADSLGSNDTVTPSEVSTTVTVDTLSSNASHTASAASTAAFCGSLASFDTTGSGSILNIEGVPLLEEADKEPIASHQEVV